jgi:hypothetical protein
MDVISVLDSGDCEADAMETGDHWTPLGLLGGANGTVPSV